MQAAAPQRMALDTFETRGLSVPSYKIFLDRYSVKDKTRETLKEGDLVLAPSSSHHGQREFAQVRKITNEEGAPPDKAHVNIVYLEGMPDGHLGLRADQLDKPLELDPAQMWCRVADGVAQNSSEAASFAALLQDWQFVPAGRILAFAGTGQALTGSNCFVLGSPHDSREGIWKTQAQMAETFARGGGCGINLSTLRPRYCYVKGVNGRSSGAVSWGGLYSFVTGLIEQGGSRRGALMLILNDWHPDFLEFITVKREEGVISNANMSIALSEEFMQAVKEDGTWQLEFPDTSFDLYDGEWTGNLQAWKAKGYPVVVYETHRARDLWEKICESAHACADPGIWFEGRANALSNSGYFNRLICTNPCGEQSLPAWGVCNLGHLNLVKFLDTSRGYARGTCIDVERLREATRTAVRFLDNVIDGQAYYVPETGTQQMHERRVGLGTMGLGEMLIRMGVRYGSQEAVDITREVYKTIAVAAYQMSCRLAQEKGPFPAFTGAMLRQPFVQKVLGEMDGQQVAEIEQHGFRNVTLLTQAPTGTVGTMVGTTTGIEPYYSWETWRNSRVGIHKEVASVVTEWRARADVAESDGLPDYFVSAMELKPEEHVEMQAAAQEWTDASISKTINCPADWTKEQVQQLYELLYEKGCKGGTIYRDKCKERQVLTLEKPDQPLGGLKVSAKQANGSARTNGSSPWPLHVAPSKSEVKKVALPIHPFRPLLEVRNGMTTTLETPLGRAHVTLNRDDDDQPYEVFIDVGKAGSETKAQSEAIGRLISLILRLESPVSPDVRLQHIAEQLLGIGGPRPSGFGPNKVNSLPAGVALAIQRLGLGKVEAAPEQEDLTNFTGQADLCPSCGAPSVYRADGCEKCFSCSWSQC